jgi:hypothetical protein
VQGGGIFCHEKWIFHRASGAACVNERSHFGGQAASRASAARGYTRTFVLCVLGLFAFAAVPLRSRAQLPQQQAPPSWGKVPQGTGACSVEKSCADLAPAMIQDALGASPLEPNIHELAGILSSDGTGANKDAAAWAEAALKSSGADEVRVEEIGPSKSIEIVIAEIRGRDLPRDYVLVPAPVFEAGPSPQGAAENVAVLIDAVRVIHATGNIPRRSIRFMFYPAATEISGERLAALWAYMSQHRADLDHIAAAVSIGAASGLLDGYSLEDRPEMLPVVREAIEPLRSLGIGNFSEGVQVGANTMPFWLEGIPTLVETSAGEKAGSGDSPRVESAAGSLDAARLQQLKRAVAVAAVTAYALADAQTRIGPRRSPAEVQRSIKSLGIEAQLKAAGLWTEWQALQPQGKH